MKRTVYLVMCLMKRCIRVKIREKLEFIFSNNIRSQSYPRDCISVLYSQSVLYFFCSQTSRDLATTSSCIFLRFFSRFPRLMMMMMMLVVVVIVVVFPVTAVLATFSFSPLFFFARARKSTPSRSSNRQHISVVVLL
jgi:hypothetical protein